jgi:hypothetical protein
MGNKRKLVGIAALAVILFGNPPLDAQEAVYPAGYRINSDYSLNADKIAVTDTLVIQRLIVNNEGFGLTGLYFSDNLPPQLEIADYSVSINGAAVSHMMSGPIRSLGPPGYDNYFWVVDLPGDTGAVNNTVLPGDSVAVTTMIICNDLGRCTLPSHAATFYGNGTGFFSTSDSLEVEFVLSLDVDDDPYHMLPPGSLVSLAYPNPSNASVTIRYAGDGLKGKAVAVEVYDLLGRRMYENSLVSGDKEGYIEWNPPESISSGLYVYTLSAGKRRTRGKIVLLK